MPEQQRQRLALAAREGEDASRATPGREATPPLVGPRGVVQEVFPGTSQVVPLEGATGLAADVPERVVLTALVGIERQMPGDPLERGQVAPGEIPDSPELPALVASSAQRFRLQEVSADKAHLGHANLACIEAAGAVPYVPFKSNSLDKGSAAWRRMYATFLYRQEEFLAHYHKRSNVEATFSAIKRKFGGSVRSKRFTAQTNEILCKILCHNLTVLVHAMHELGIEPTFAAVAS
jgi:hypothetical protein